MKVAIDTNILIYVLQGHDQFGVSSRLVLSSFAKSDIFASEAVFGEILSNRVFTGNETALKRAKRFLEEADITYIPTTRQVYVDAARLRRSRPSIKLPDALHLVSAWMNQVDAFVTNDNDLVRCSTDDRKIVRLETFAGRL